MSFNHIKKILDGYFKGTNFKEINNTISIHLAWEKTVGKPIINNTQIKSFSNGTIIIKVSNPIWRNELSLQKNDLLLKLQNTEPELNIKKIILK